MENRRTIFFFSKFCWLSISISLGLLVEEPGEVAVEAAVVPGCTARVLFIGLGVPHVWPAVGVYWEH